ncbi:MAG: efflux RND transporter periplasmic adaptor subunit [Bacteroidetes bacterium]|nr:efflux RND transporter periplasmic adaptor subunit [Bacteroidota bacterium]
MDRIIEKKKGIKKKHFPYIAGGVVILALILFMFLQNRSSTLNVEKDKVTIETITRGQFDDYITVIGQVEPISTIYLDALEGGRVVERYIEEGEMVKKGDVILKLENRELYQTILISETSLAEKENYLRTARINFEVDRIQSKRNLLDNKLQLSKSGRKFEQDKKLYENKLISKEEYQQAEEDYMYQKELLEINKQKAESDSLIKVKDIAQLESDMVKMRKALMYVQERLDNLLVKAPVDGQLGMLNAEIGQQLGQGTRLGQINVLSGYKVQALMDEHYIDRVNPGLTGTLDRQDKEFSLRVHKVYPEVRQGQFKIDLVFTGNLPENIRTGQSYHIKLQLGEPTEAVLLPQGAFYQSTGGQWIYVLDKSGQTAVKRNIRIGSKNPLYFEVLEGLKPGDQVITSGYELFGDNERLVLK